MGNNRSKPEKSGWGSRIRAVAFSCCIGLVIMAAFLLLFALLLSVKDLPHGAIEPMALCAGILGAIAAGFCCARILGEHGLLLGLLCGSCLFLLFLLSSLMVSDDGFGMRTFLKWLILALSGSIGGVLGVNIRKRRRY